MSPLTIFLAKLIGLYCIIAAVAMMAHKSHALATIEALIRNAPLLLLAEVLGLVAGLAMVIGHNIWSGGVLPVVITLLGWLMAIRGAVLLALPPDTTAKLFEAVRYEERFTFFMAGTLALGLYLTVAGFAA
jgi:hypothetical protein